MVPPLPTIKTSTRLILDILNIFQYTTLGIVDTAKPHPHDTKNIPIYFNIHHNGSFQYQSSSAVLLVQTRRAVHLLGLMVLRVQAPFTVLVAPVVWS